MSRRVTPATVKKIQAWEGFSAVAYQDQGGVWTIGHGHTGPEIVEGLTCNMKQAETWLRADLAIAERAVSDLVEVDLNDNQFGALVSFVFNVGVAAFRNSTLLRLLNAGNYAAVPGQFARWNKIGKTPNRGLSNRRAAEAGLWVSGDFVASASVTPASAHPPPLARSKTMQGAGLTSAGVLGSALTDTASQVQVVADYSETLRIVFVVLILAGIALTLWGRVSLRNREGV